MNGTNSKLFQKFRKLMIKGFLALREHAEEIISFVEMTMISGLDFHASRAVIEFLNL